MLCGCKLKKKFLEWNVWFSRKRQKIGRDVEARWVWEFTFLDIFYGRWTDFWRSKGIIRNV